MMQILHLITFILVILGALDLGLMGAADYNLIHSLLGAYPMAAKVVYILIGASGLYQIFDYFTARK